MADKKQKRQTREEAEKELLGLLDDSELATHHSTGFLTIDKLLGGGVPSNGTMMIWGLPGSGKTTFLYIMMAQMIRDGKKVLYVPTEKWDKRYLLNALGLPHDIDAKELRKYIWIRDGNEQEDVIRFMLKTAAYKFVDAIILDSVSAFVPIEMMQEVVDGSFGAVALTNNKLLRRLPKICAKNNISFVFTGQVRVDMAAQGNYTAYTVPGGMLAMKHASSIIVQTKRPEQVLLKSQVGGGGDEDKKKLAKLAFSMDFNVVEARSVGCYANTSVTPTVIVTDSVPKPDLGDEILTIGDLYGVFSNKEDEPLFGKVSPLSIRKYNGRLLGNRSDARDIINSDGALLDELYNVVRAAIIHANAVNVIGIPNSYDDLQFEEAEIEDEL